MVLGALAAAYPNHPAGADTVELYHQALRRLDSADTLQAAAGRWVETEDRYPTVHQLVEAYQAHARWQADAARAADEARAIARGTLPGMPAAAPQFAIEMVDVLRVATEEATAGSRKHDHVRGAAHCPVCASAASIADGMAARVKDLLANRGIVPGLGPVPTFRCAECFDRGMVVHDGDPFTAHPCPACNPDGFALWEGGHYQPGHWCPECKDPGGARPRR